MADEDRTFAARTVQAPTRGAEATAPGQPQTDLAGEELDGDDGALGPADGVTALHAREANPEEDWGDPADEGTVFSSTHTRRGVGADAARRQGAKTRQHTKDIFSRRG